MLGREGGLEERLVPAAGFDLQTIRVRGLDRDAPWKNLALPWLLPTALAKATLAKLRLADVWPPAMIVLGLLLFAFAHQVLGWLFAIRRLRGRRRFFEIMLLTLNTLLWIILIALLGWRGVGMFIGSHIVASLYLAAIIAPNHKGMPVWAKGRKLSFLEREVLSSRNVNSHPIWDFLYGGLNYQIEHHLFPTMPRVHLKQARSIVKPFCSTHSLPYEEVSPIASYRMVFAEFTRLRRALSVEG